MTTLNQVYDSLASTLSTAFSLTPVRGWPRWGQPPLSPPLLSLLLQSARRPARRVGQRQRQIDITLTLFAANETALLSLVESFETWLNGIATISASGSTVTIEASEGIRHPNETGLEQEDYAFTFTLTLTW